MLKFWGRIGGFQSPTPDAITGKSLFIHLPREIRDLIYQYVFNTAAKYVCLKPAIHLSIAFSQLRLCNYNPNGRHTGIDLCLFMVCKSIKEESMDFFWGHKILVIEPTDQSIYCRNFGNVQHVRLELDLGCGTDPKWTKECLEYLERWAEAGNLKTLDVNIVQDRENLLCVAEVRGAKKMGWVSCRSIPRKEVVGRWGQYMAVLRDHGKNAANSSLAEVAIRLSIETGWNDPRFTQFQQKAFLNLAGPKNIQGLIEDVAVAFGGELWQDGRLCWKDNVQVSEAFQLRGFVKASCGCKSKCWNRENKQREMEYKR